MSYQLNNKSDNKSSIIKLLNLKKNNFESDVLNPPKTDKVNQTNPSPIYKQITTQKLSNNIPQPNHKPYKSIDIQCNLIDQSSTLKSPYDYQFNNSQSENEKYNNQFSISKAVDSCRTDINSNKFNTLNAEQLNNFIQTQNLLLKSQDTNNINQSLKEYDLAPLNLKNQMSTIKEINERDNYKFNDFDSNLNTMNLKEDLRLTRDKLTKENIGYNSDQRFTNLNDNIYSNPQSQYEENLKIPKDYNFSSDSNRIISDQDQQSNGAQQQIDILSENQSSNKKHFDFDFNSAENNVTNNGFKETDPNLQFSSNKLDQILNIDTNKANSKSFIQLKGLDINNKDIKDKSESKVYASRQDSTYNTGDSLARSSFEFEDDAEYKNLNDEFKSTNPLLRKNLATVQEVNSSMEKSINSHAQINSVDPNDNSYDQTLGSLNNLVDTQSNIHLMNTDKTFINSKIGRINTRNSQEDDRSQGNSRLVDKSNVISNNSNTISGNNTFINDERLFQDTNKDELDKVLEEFNGGYNDKNHKNGQYKQRNNTSNSQNKSQNISFDQVEEQSDRFDTNESKLTLNKERDYSMNTNSNSRNLNDRSYNDNNSNDRLMDDINNLKVDDQNVNDISVDQMVESQIFEKSSELQFNKSKSTNHQHAQNEEYTNSMNNNNSVHSSQDNKNQRNQNNNLENSRYQSNSNCSNFVSESINIDELIDQNVESNQPYQNDNHQNNPNIKPLINNHQSRQDEQYQSQQSSHASQSQSANESRNSSQIQRNNFTNQNYNIQNDFDEDHQFINLKPNSVQSPESVEDSQAQSVQSKNLDINEDDLNELGENGEEKERMLVIGMDNDKDNHIMEKKRMMLFKKMEERKRVATEQALNREKSPFKDTKNQPSEYSGRKRTFTDSHFDKENQVRRGNAISFSSDLNESMYSNLVNKNDQIEVQNVSVQKVPIGIKNKRSTSPMQTKKQSQDFIQSEMNNVPKKEMKRNRSVVNTGNEKDKLNNIDKQNTDELSRKTTSKTKDRQEQFNEIHLKNNKYNQVKPKQDFEALTNIKKIRLCLEKNIFVGSLNKIKLKDNLDVLERHQENSDRKDSQCLLLDQVTKQFKGLYVKRGNADELQLEKIYGQNKASQCIENKDIGGQFTQNYNKKEFIKLNVNNLIQTTDAITTTK